ncbi:MAG: outer membrane lipid asymmetry maintenance protein MlaD [Cardiobacteriaceae bacterium]|nr:outer membrane lipid asymmetry maintenance protein MlaD [Cardiobacteriaceae bacterium]
MNKSTLTTSLVGLFVLSALASLAFLGFQTSNLAGFRPERTFELKAYFRDVSGLSKSASVQLSGVQIGRIKTITLDPKRGYQALVWIELDRAYENILPEDSTLEVLTSGLLGEKYLGITLGGADETLKHQDEISFTGSSIVIEKLIQQVITQMSNS